jgi:type I restriction enzyme S subunit
MKIQSNIPQLRFKEFEGEWKIDIIGNTCTVKTGGSDTQDRIENGMYPFFVRSNTVERINKFSFDGEAILTSGDGVGVGKNFHYIDGKFDYHQRVYALREFRNGYSGKFIYHFFSEKFYKRVIKLSAKNSVDSVRMNMITEMKISLPSLPEQQKIASFLSAVDEKIQQLTRKGTLLEQYKKGVMQQLFSGKLRFKDENGNDYAAWEEKKCGEVTSYTKGFAFKSKDYQNFGVRIIRVSDLLSSSIKVDNEKVFISYEKAKIYDKYKLEKGNIIITTVGSKPDMLESAVGRGIIIHNENEGLLNQNMLKFENIKGVDNRFLINMINTKRYQYFLKDIARGNANQANITVVDLLNYKIVLPSFQEQQKIADFLSGVDAKIESVNQQINQTQSFKKGLLQQLFVCFY